MTRIVVDGFGKYVGREQNLIVIKDKGKVVGKYDPSNVSQVIISGKGSISTDAIELLSKNRVNVVFLNLFGEIVAVISHPLIGTVNTRKKQYEAYENRRGVLLSKEFTIAKMKNQMAVLGTLAKARKDSDQERADHLMHIRNEIENELKKIEGIAGRKIDDIRDRIMGIEGNASSLYWDALRMIFPEEYGFSGRKGLDEKHSRYAQDIINAMFNYGYSILFGDCLRAIQLAGLDPYGGFLHVDRSGRKSLALDLMEEFRQQIVDKAVIKLINYRQIKPDECEMINNVCRLEGKARKILSKDILTRLDKKIEYRGRKIRFTNVILGQAREIVRFVKGESKRYTGFYLRW